MKIVCVSGKTGLSRLATPTTFMGLIAFLTPPFTLYLPLSLAIILAAGAVIMMIFRILGWLPRPNLDLLPLLAIGGLMFIVALSTLWSYAPEHSLDRLPRTLLAVLAGVIFISAVKALDGHVTRTTSRCFLSGMAMTLFLIGVETQTGGMLLRNSIDEDTLSSFLNQLNRPLSILSVLIWPAAVMLAARHWALAFSAVGIFAAFLPFFITSAAIAAVVVGAVIFSIVYILPKTGAAIVGFVLATGVLAAPTIDHYLPPPEILFDSLNLPRSTYHRLLVWEFTTQRVDERPILGWGFNTSRVIPGGDENLDVSEKALPLHPHNAALQWRLELGVLGVLFGAGIILIVTEMARKHSAGRVARAGAVATIGATFVIAMISFGAWQTWWISAIFLIAGFTILACRRSVPG